MVKRVAINGFGRIGRLVMRGLLERDDVEVVAVNDLTDSETLAHLFAYDSVHGRWAGNVEAGDGTLTIDGSRVQVLSERDPGALPWEALSVDLTIECTGRFTRREDAARHLSAGARKVIISAPGKNEDLTIVLGVNQGDYDPAKHDVISNASCTTNCLAPVAKVILDEFGFRRGLMTTVHAYTNDQPTLDSPHKDLRRARAAAVSMIPTTTGAARATARVLPELEGRLDGMAIRVPTPDVSLVDLTCEVERDVTADEVNAAFLAASEGPMKGILGTSDVPLVSIDYVGNSHSSVVDLPTTAVMDGRLVKVLSWYDNEWGYASRIVDLTGYVAERMGS